MPQEMGAKEGDGEAVHGHGRGRVEIWEGGAAERVLETNGREGRCMGAVERGVEMKETRRRRRLYLEEWGI